MIEAPDEKIAGADIQRRISKTFSISKIAEDRPRTSSSASSRIGKPIEIVTTERAMTRARITSTRTRFQRVLGYSPKQHGRGRGNAISARHSRAGQCLPNSLDDFPVLQRTNHEAAQRRMTKPVAYRSREGAGFIGSHMVDHFARGAVYRVPRSSTNLSGGGARPTSRIHGQEPGFDPRAPRHSSAGFPRRRCFRDAKIRSSISRGSATSYRRSSGPFEYMDTNVQRHRPWSSKRRVRAAASESLFYAALFVLATALADTPTREDSQARPRNNPYALSKLMGEAGGVPLAQGFIVCRSTRYASSTHIGNQGCAPNWRLWRGIFGGIPPAEKLAGKPFTRWSATGTQKA